MIPPYGSCLTAKRTAVSLHCTADGTLCQGEGLAFFRGGGYNRAEYCEPNSGRNDPCTNMPWWSLICRGGFWTRPAPCISPERRTRHPPAPGPLTAATGPGFRWCSPCGTIGRTGPMWSGPDTTCGPRAGSPCPRRARRPCPTPGRRSSAGTRRTTSL